MSININRTANVKILDPRTDVNEKQYFAILKGGKQVNMREIPSTTFSNSSAQFSNPPPSPQIFFSRRVMLKQPVTITFSGDSNDANRNLLQSGADAFRAFPLASVMNTLDVSINGVSTSLNVNDLIKPLLLYHNNARNLGQRENSLSPSYMDQTQSYADLDGSIRNPLASFFDSNAGAYMGRGGFPYDSFSNTPTGAVLTATLTEELFISPLIFGGAEGSSFLGVQNFVANIVWDSNLSRIWSHSSASSSTITSIDVVLGQPSLLYTYITPSILQPLPASIAFSYNDIQRYPTDLNSSVASDAQVTLSSSNIQLNAIPSFVYIFARKRNQDLTFNDTDSYFSIEQINVNWSNNNGELGDSSKQQLYDVSRRNGVNLSWTEWSGENTYSYLGNTTTRINSVGSVLALAWGLDIGLNEDECSGLLGTFQLQIKAVCKNVSQSAISPTLYIVVITPGTFTITNNTAMKDVGVINKENVLDAQQIEGVEYNDLRRGLMSGGLNFKKLFKKGLRHVRKRILPLVSEFAPQYATQADVLQRALKPVRRRKRKTKGSALVGGCRGRALVGGKMMTKAELMRRLKY